MSDLDLLGDDPVAPTGALPGLYFATVSDVEDPKKLGRVKLLLPTLGKEIATAWARVLAPAAGEKGGLYWPLEVGDEVLAAFVGGHPELPVVVGGLWSTKKLALVPEAARRVHHLLATPAGHTLRLDDTADAQKLEIVAAGAENSLTVDVASGTISVVAKTKLEIKVGADITLTMSEGKVELTCKQLVVTSPDDVTFTSDAIKLDAKSLALNGSDDGVILNDGALKVTK